MQISINANRCEPSPMRKFHPLAVQAKKEGKKIYHLNIGQPDLPTPPAFYPPIPFGRGSACLWLSSSRCRGQRTSSLFALSML